MTSNWLFQFGFNFVENRNRIIYKGSEDLNESNALFLSLFTTNDKKIYYWQFNCDSVGVFVGITSKKYFNENYSVTGAFFNGNLFDGCNVLTYNFGDVIKKKCEIGYIIEKTEDELKIYIIQNNKPLGLGYHFKDNIPETLYPVVHFSNEGVVEITEKNVPITDYLLKRDEKETTIIGEWKLLERIYKNNVYNCKPYLLKITYNDGLYFNFNVLNEITSKLVLVRKDDEGDIYETKNLFITIKEQNENNMEEENYLYDILKKLRRLKLSKDSNTLSIICNKDITLLFERNFYKLEPYTDNIFID